MNDYRELDVWGEQPKRKRARERIVPKYDVKITLNKRGDSQKGMAIRFAFHCNASKMFEGMSSIEISSVKKNSKRIYFKPHAENAKDVRANDRKVFSLSKNSNSTTNARYTVYSPADGEEKIYRMFWVNNTYTINYDPEYDVYYIEC